MMLPVLIKNVDCQTFHSWNNRCGRRGGGLIVSGFQTEPTDPPLYSRRHFITWCRSCQPLKLFVLTPVSDERRR
jgi:hypothetical protein